ncbi:MAG: class II glutamine amidotransferase [Thermoplasmata archaeon]
MCRLFGVLGGAKVPAEPWLVSTERSLLVQANTSEKNAQRDGWGIAWYETTRTPRVDKGIGGAYAPEEKEHFVAASRRAHGPVVVGHLRHASNPMNLPHERLIALENSQPFTFGSYLFAHNGSISFPRETRPLLEKFESHVHGVNDSEVLFWLFTRHLEQEGDPLHAYARTVVDLLAVARQRGGADVTPYTGLNIVFSRGPNEIWAFCHWRGEHGTRFLDATRPYYEMTYSADAKRVVIGSEPFDANSEAWRPIPNGTYLYAHAAHGLVALKTGSIPLPVEPTAAVPVP